MKVRLHPHARQRMIERGAAETEVVQTAETGEAFPAKFGRQGFRKTFAYNNVWLGRPYASRQVEAVAVREDDDWLVITCWLNTSEVLDMELTYDRQRNIAYIRFRQKSEQVRTVSVSDELTVDLAPDGSVYGIELLNANEQLIEGPEGRLQVRNLTTGQTSEVPLAG